MPAPHSSQRPLEESDRRIQQFLERAASIVLEGPELTTERWQQLSSIANEYELTAGQFHATLDDLIARGVLKRVDAVLPKPPPLPRPRTGEESRPPSLPREVESPSPPARVVPPARPPVVPALAAAEANRGVEPPASVEQTPAPSMQAPEMPMNVATPKTESPDGPAVPEKTDARWRIEGGPAPEAARPTKKPHEIYREFVRQSLAYIEKGEISFTVEQRLLQHGTRVLSLSSVFARHLLEEVAAQQGYAFASPNPNPSSDDSGKELADHSSWDESSSRDERTADRSTSSSVKFVERTVATSELAKRHSASQADYVQLERLIPLRQYLHTTLDRMPRGLLPLQTLDKLMSAGMDLFGVEAEFVLETVRHVAGELKIAVVTRQQAEEYVSEYAANMLDNDVALTLDQVDQVRHAGAQWGLSTAQTDAIVDEVSRAKKAARRREEITARLALGAAGIAALLVVCFIGYAFISAQSPRPAAPTHVPEQP